MRKSIVFSVVSIFLVLIIINLNLYSKYDFSKFYHFPENVEPRVLTIYSIYQDSSDFIWFGTFNGLYRFDGYKFIFYPDHRNDYKNRTTVYSLFEDSRSNLWIGTYFNGLRKIQLNDNNNKNKLENILFSQKFKDLYVKDILEDSIGNLWIGSWGKGLFYLNKKNGQVKNFSKGDNNSISSNWITSLVFDKNGNLFIGTEEGLNIFNIESGKFHHHLPSKENRSSISHKRISSLFIDSSGNIWIGTRNGLNRLIKDKGEFIQYMNDPDDVFSLSNNWVSCIKEDKIGQLWIGTKNGSINIFDPKKNIFYNHKNNPDIKEAFGTQSNILSILIDKSGIVWIGTKYNGLFNFDNKFNQFKNYHIKPDSKDKNTNNIIWSIDSKNKNTLWIGANNGLNKFNLSTKQNEIFKLKNKKTHSNKLRSIAIDNKGDIWAGFERNGLYKFYPESKTFKDFNWIHKNKQFFVFTILLDDKEILWIGTYGDGLIRFDTKTNEVQNYFNKVKKENRFTQGSVSSIFKDKEGNIWVGTYGGGLYIYNQEKNKFKYIKILNNGIDILKNKTIITINEDKSGDFLWIGTHGTQFGKLNKDSFSYIHYNFNDLNISSVYSIIPDINAYIWVVTENGLFKYNEKEKTYTKYNHWDGIKNIDYSMNSFFVNQKGEIFFGGDKGITHFNPKKIKRNEFEPKIVITSFTKHGQTNSLVNTFNIGEKISLYYKDSFSIEFAALNYSNTQNNRYAYKITGIHKDWIYLGHKREITFNNLNPGNYILKIKGSNNDGVWNERGLEIELNVKPPFWLTIWFKAIMFLLIIILFFYWHKTRIKRIAKKLKTEASMEKFFLKNKVTETEKAIILLVIRGKNNKDIEEKLFISHGTVRNNVSKIYKKLNVKNRFQLINIFKNLE